MNKAEQLRKEIAQLAEEMQDLGDELADKEDELWELENATELPEEKENEDDADEPNSMG